MCGERIYYEIYDDRRTFEVLFLFDTCNFSFDNYLMFEHMFVSFVRFRVIVIEHKTTFKRQIAIHDEFRTVKIEFHL